MATVDPNEIREKLIARGLPPHIAEGFVMNFQDESGLDPGINERNPIVPGSRGGFGLYQLTGPRRVEYEAFASERGVDPSDVDAQLDFMMMELQGPESAAARSIMSAPDAGSAAAAIVRDFLRPSAEYRDQRAASYLGTPTQSRFRPMPGGAEESDFARGYQPSNRVADLYGEPVDPLSLYNPYAILERFRLQ
jgi:hypothetical protein